MANRRQIPFLTWRGDNAWWKPSPRLRALGWTSLLIGTRADPDAAIDACLKRNRQLAQWEEARRTNAALPAPAQPKIWTVEDLIAAYKAGTDWTAELRQSTRAEYATRLRFIDRWARDPAGRSIAVKAIDTDMVRDLKDSLLDPDEHGTPRGSRFRCAATLRVLRLLLNRPEALKLTGGVNATAGVAIPGTPSRTHTLDLAAIEALAASFRTAGESVAARYLTIGFWSLQREADLLALNRMAWRTFEALDPRDRPALANPRGEVKGFRLLQEKTKVWVDAPMPPSLHDEIEAAFEQSQWLFPDPLDPARPMPEWRIQRLFRALRNTSAGDLADKQLRDLRRSGMVFYRDKGAALDEITAISGHSVLGKRTILDTYMPPQTERCCAAVAAVLRTLERIREREKADGE